MNRIILITNDDGIKSDGLRRLVHAAKDFGEIWVVAPDDQRSASSHSITVHGTIDIYPYDYGIEGVKAYVCMGTPGDCVRAGSLGVMLVQIYNIPVLVERHLKLPFRDIMELLFLKGLMEIMK